jgi:hypothetical protein
MRSAPLHTQITEGKKERAARFLSLISPFLARCCFHSSGHNLRRFAGWEKNAGERV